MRELIVRALEKIRHALRRRPVRVIEGLLGVLAVAGVVDLVQAEELLEQVGQLLMLLGVAGAGGALEWVQTRTTSLYDPRDADGRSLVPSDDPHAAHHYDPPATS